jgi:hypothetical protein
MAGVAPLGSEDTGEDMIDESQALAGRAVGRV